MIMCEKLPEEIREKIYTYAHPSFTKKQKDYIKLQTKINERKRFMAEYCLYIFEAFVKGEPINTELTYDEVVSSINILSKCTCCKNHFSKSTKKIVFRCPCIHYIKTLFEVLGEDHNNLYIYKNMDCDYNMRSWNEFKKSTL
jgi:hypothetical protein